MSIQQKYIESKGWHYIGTQENLIFYRKSSSGEVLTMRLENLGKELGKA